MKDKLKKLDQLFRTDKVIQQETLLVRSDKRANDTIFKNNIRKDRETQDTSGFIDYVVEAIRRVDYPEMPARSGVKFCVTNHSGAKRDLNQYGGRSVYIFPSSDCELWTNGEDPFKNFSSLEKNLSSIRQLYGEINRYDNNRPARKVEHKELYALKSKYSTIYRFFSEALQMDNLALKHSYDVEFLERNISDLQNEIRVFLTRPHISKITESAIRGIKAIFEEVDYYWSSTNRWDGQSPSQEIMIKGSYYLGVNIKWFDSNFDWDNNRWKLKEEPENDMRWR